MRPFCKKPVVLPPLHLFTSLTTMATLKRDPYAIPSVRVAAIERLTLIRFAAPLTEEVKLGLIAGLVSSLRETPQSHLQAVETVINLLHIAVPEMGGVMGTLHTLTTSVIQLTEGEVREWMGMDEPAEGAGRTRPLNLPSDPAPLALSVTKTTAVYASVASVLFAMGRQASESAQTAALDKRPDALIRRFDIGEEDRLLFPGREAGPSRASLECIYNAFSTYSEIRAEIVRFFIGLRRSTSHLPIHLEVLMTNFHLMRGAGMTHVDAILRLARMHPWTVRIPELEPYYSHFADELVKFQAIDEDVRPYHRLLTSQNEFLFVSAEYRPLIAVAGSFIAEVEKTFKGYVYNASQYAELIDKVHSYAPQYHPTARLTTLTSLLNIPDVDLPTPAPKKVTQGEEVV
jgi:hypothetical protein